MRFFRMEISDWILNTHKTVRMEINNFHSGLVAKIFNRIVLEEIQENRSGN